MPRRQRQRDEVRELCRSGALGRAVDLATQHLAEFGTDDALLDLLAAAVEREAVPDAVRRRFAELRSSLARAPRSAGDQPAVSAGAHGPSQITRSKEPVRCPPP